MSSPLVSLVAAAVAADPGQQTGVYAAALASHAETPRSVRRALTRLRDHGYLTATPDLPRPWLLWQPTPKLLTALANREPVTCGSPDWAKPSAQPYLSASRLYALGLKR